MANGGFNCTDKPCSASIKDKLTKELLVDPDSLDGVASAYRYKVGLLNDELTECDIEFEDKGAVFSFQDVDKKRALKKEEWPLKVTGLSKNLYTVKLQLFAGDTEITDCTGCSAWKEKTTKPFLILTPEGDKSIRFTSTPFLLLIFRCCPKFHGFSKQFRLVITITSKDQKIVYRGGLDINRKKFSKKRCAEECSSEDIPPNKALCTWMEPCIDSRMNSRMDSRDLMLNYPLEYVEPRPRLLISPVSARFPFPTPPDLTYFPPHYAPKELVSSHYVCDLISNNQEALPNKGVSMQAPNPRYQWDQVFPELYDNPATPSYPVAPNYHIPSIHGNIPVINNNWNYPPQTEQVCTKCCCVGPNIQEVCVDDYLVPEMPTTTQGYRQNVNFSTAYWSTA